MPSFTSAVAVQRLSDQPDGAASFAGVIDIEWSVNGTPHGGYLLSLVMNAFGQVQEASGTGQSDPAHVMVSYFRAAREGPITINASVVKKGFRWTNLQATLVQNGETLIFCQALYTKLPPLPTTSLPFSTANQNLLPLTPSPYAPITPFLTHPARCSAKNKPTDVGRRWSDTSVLWFAEDSVPWNDDPKGNSMRWGEDPALKAKRVGTGAEKELKLEWGAWCEFKRPEDHVDNTSLALFADIMSSIPELFPHEGVDPQGNTRVASTYYPTLALSVQFHASLPLPAPYLSSTRTVGCYSYGKIIHQGRHEQCVEVWSAPGEIGQGEEQDGWRSKCMLLVTATQIALSVPVSSMKTGLPKPAEKL